MSPQTGDVRVEIFGIGSAHGADQVGWRVIDYLQRIPDRLRSTDRAYRLQSPMDLMAHAMASELNSVSAWIIVDACLGSSTGRIHTWRWAELPKLDSQDDRTIGFRAISSHGFGLIEALQMGETLGVLPSVVWIYGLEVGEEPVGLDEGIDWEPSEALHEAIARCAEEITTKETKHAKV